jgi:hypothetical protein
LLAVPWPAGARLPTLEYSVIVLTVVLAATQEQISGDGAAVRATRKLVDHVIVRVVRPSVTIKPFHAKTRFVARSALTPSERRKMRPRAQARDRPDLGGKDLQDVEHERRVRALEQFDRNLNHGGGRLGRQ